MNPSPTPAEIRAARLAAGLTMRELALILGLSGQSRISEYEHGQRNMSAQLWELMQYKLRIRTRIASLYQPIKGE